jgi:hypothetical protein
MWTLARRMRGSAYAWSLRPPAVASAPGSTLSPVRFGILGPLEVEYDGRPVRLGRRRDRAVLALLILADGRPVTVDTLVEAL